MNIIKTVTLGKVTYNLFSDVVDGEVKYGWYNIANVPGGVDSGRMYNGKQFSVSRAKFDSLDKAKEDLQTDVNYYYGIRRSVSKPVIEA